MCLRTGYWDGNERILYELKSALFRGCRGGNEPHITHNKGTPDPSRLCLMQQGMTAQDAGASLAVEHAAGQMPRAPPSLAIKQSSRGFAIIIVLKGPVPSDLSVSELGSDDSLWMLSANAERELFADHFSLLRMTFDWHVFSRNRQLLLPQHKHMWLLRTLL